MLQKKCVWYVVKTAYSNTKSIKDTIMENATKVNMQEYILEIYAPKVKTPLQKKDGDMVIKEQLLYGPYLFINVDWTNAVPNAKSIFLAMLGNTYGVAKIMGTQKKASNRFSLDIFQPYILSDEEMKQYKQFALESEYSESKYNFEVGDQIRITGKNFHKAFGVIKNIDVENKRAKIESTFMQTNFYIDVEFKDLEKI